jgi:hypothetical protein
MVVASGIVHPTTCAFFILWLGLAMLAGEPRLRRVAWVGLPLGAMVAGWLLVFGPLAGRLGRMDPAWLAVLTEKDYLFPDRWPLAGWIVNLAYPLVIAAIYRKRQQSDLVTQAETGLVAGAIGLAALFLVTLPLVWFRVAMAVQLQIPRVFWILDVWTMAYLAWWVIDTPWAGARMRHAVTVGLVLAAIARGGWVTLVEHGDRPPIQFGLPDDDWTRTLAWVRTNTAISAYLLVPPGHAWQYGSSARIGAERDVFLEDTKDSAVAMYAREVAMRVRTRQEALGDFDALTPEATVRLADTYGLTHLVTTHPIGRPALHQDGRFWVYSLGGSR